MDAFARTTRAARLELVDDAGHHRVVHFRHFEALADSAQQRHMQFAAKMLVEFSQPLDDLELARRRAPGEGFIR